MGEPWARGGIEPNLHSYDAMAGSMTKAGSTACAAATSAPTSSARDPVAALHLYRIAQEAVRAAALQAGAREVELLLRPEADRVAMVVRADGGAALPEGALDLRTTRYRAGVVGASLEVRPAAGGGAEIVCVFPQGA